MMADDSTSAATGPRKTKWDSDDEDSDHEKAAPAAQKQDSPEPGEISDSERRDEAEATEVFETPAPAEGEGVVAGIVPYEMFLGCRNVDEVFQDFTRIDEGAYGVVFRAKVKDSDETVALKKVKLHREKEGFPITALREVTLLLSLNHPNIVNVREVVVNDSVEKVYMVMEWMEHDMKGLMEVMREAFTAGQVKCLMKQLLEATAYMHDNWVLHRDLKTSNLLYNNQGILKVCDFGLSRTYADPLKNYTGLVVTLWYRAPELLLGAKTYSTAIDVWSVGCIFGEFLLTEPLLPGKGEVDQLDRIFKLCGTPTEKTWPGFSKLPGAQKMRFKSMPCRLRERFAKESYKVVGGRKHCALTDLGVDLLSKLLCLDPEQRISAAEALEHPYFTQEHPPPADPLFMPTYPATQQANKMEMKNKRKRSLDDEQIKQREQFNNDEERFSISDNRATTKQLLKQMSALARPHK